MSVFALADDTDDTELSLPRCAPANMDISRCEDDREAILSSRATDSNLRNVPGDRSVAMPDSRPEPKTSELRMSCCKAICRTLSHIQDV